MNNNFYQGQYPQEVVDQLQQQIEHQQQRHQMERQQLEQQHQQQTQQQHQQRQQQLQYLRQRQLRDQRNLSQISIPQTGPIPHGPHTAHPLAGLQSMMMANNEFQDVAQDGQAQEMHRRRSSVPHAFVSQPATLSAQSPHERRMSVMEFGSAEAGFGSYPFTAEGGGSVMGGPFEAINSTSGGSGGSGGGGDGAGNSGGDGDNGMVQMTGFGGSDAFPAMSSDMMSSMIPDTFADLNMGIGTLGEGSIVGPYDAAAAFGGADFMGMEGGQQIGEIGQLGQLGQMTADQQLRAQFGAHFVPEFEAPFGAQFGIGQFDGRFLDVMEMADGGGGGGEVTTTTTLPDDLGDTVMTADSDMASTSLADPSSSISPFSGSAPTPNSSMPSNRGSIAGTFTTSLQEGGAATTTTTARTTTPPGPSPPGPSPPQGQTTTDSSPSTTVGFPRPRPLGSLMVNKGPYTKSGFDCMTALMLVATRKNPQLHLGAVDMSCAFVVTDVKLPDCPIVYVSPNFQNLTGYHGSEILGKNCRFLQAPDGQVEAGSQRQYVDDSAVFNLKDKIAKCQEVQQSLINYRKGGKPFLNLLTMIPIPWDTDEIRYFVGFQIDIVESPGALTSGGSGVGGGMCINYTHSDLEPYSWTPPQTGRFRPGNGQTLGEHDVSTLLAAHAKRESSDWHRQSWDKMLLENADDMVHVLSLKGTFIYVSPACQRMLGYDAGEMESGSVSQFCHPSDLVGVERTLKDATAGGAVSFAWRVMRKHDGYVWVESSGAMYAPPDQGKGRKCVVLVARERPVVALSRRCVDGNGGMGENDIWAKLSASGMFLFVSSNVRSLLDHQPQALFGTSIQDMMRPESRPEFGRAIEKARRGKVVSCKHEVQHKRGPVMQAHTTLYPGDVPEGEKPTFVIAQTRLVKASSWGARSKGSTSSSSATAAATSSSLTATDSTTPTASSSSASATPSSRADGSSNTDIPTPGPTAPEIVRLLEDARDNLFDELSVKRPSSWQYELRQLEMNNRILADEVASLLANRKKRKRRKGTGNLARDCANCHTRSTPEWRRGPSGNRDLCNSCGLRWAKQVRRNSGHRSARSGGTASTATSVVGGSKYTTGTMSAATCADAADGARFSPDLEPRRKRRLLQEDANNE